MAASFVSNYIYPRKEENETLGHYLLRLFKNDAAPVSVPPKKLLLEDPTHTL